MNKNRLYLLIATFIICYISSKYTLNAQEQQKPPIEIASEQADKLQRDLNLTDHQLFYVDSILQHNFVALSKELDDLRKAGIQSRESLMNAQKKWGLKTESAFEKILTKEQFLKYLKITGRYREYHKEIKSGKK